MKVVTVLMSTFNGEKYLREQIDSILNQEGNFKLELLVRDDGSKDNTTKILDEYKGKGKLNWYTGSNMGPALSFIDLIKHSGESDYYSFADQDDFWEKEKLKNAVQNIVKSGSSKLPVLYFANASLVDSKLSSLGRNVYKAQPRTDFCTLVCAGGLLGCTMVMNDNLAHFIRKIQLSGPIVMHDFYAAVLCKALGGRIIYDENPQMKYRQHGNNVVGVSYGIIGKIKGRLKDITTKSKVSIAVQAKTVLAAADVVEISENNKKWLEEVADYDKSVFSRIKLACSLKTKYVSKNMAFKIRASILLGNR